jgi:hypothetical protein
MLVANHRHDPEAADEGGCLQAASQSELSIVAASHPAHWQVDGSELLIRPRQGSFLGPTDMAAIEHGSCEQTQEAADSDLIPLSTGTQVQARIIMMLARRTGSRVASWRSLISSRMLESPARQVECHTPKKMPESTRHAGGQLAVEYQPECLLHSFGMLTGFDWVHRASESRPCHQTDHSHWQQERLKLTHSSMGSSFWATDPMFYVLGPIGPW